MTQTDRPIDAELLLAQTDGLRALARSLLRDAHLAEDVVQDAMLAAMRRPPRADVPLGPWLVGVVRNLSRMRQRSASRRASHERVPPPGPPAEPAVAAVARAETHRLLVDAVLSLPEPYRGAVAMRYLDGLSPEQIARRSGVPAATVRTHVHRGLSLLRERLDRDHDGDRGAWVLALTPFADAGRAPRLLPLAAAVAALVVAGAATFLVLHPGRASGDADTAGGAAPTAGAVARGSVRAGTPGRGAADPHPGRARASVPGTADSDAAAQSVADASPADPAAVAAPAEGAVDAAIEVLDEQGRRLSEGTVAFKWYEADLGRGLGVECLPRASIAAANPVLLRDFSEPAEGHAVEATARVPGLPPATANFVVRRGRATPVRIVVGHGRTAAVRVVELDGETPVAGASVVSVTELTRREIEFRNVRGVPGPGSAVTDEDGRCAVGELGAGEHELEIDAPGRLRAKTKWTGAALIVRTERARGFGAVAVTVFGPGGTPAPGCRVDLKETDQQIVTGADGRAVFEGVAAGERSFYLFSGGREIDWRETESAGLVSHETSVVVEPAGRYEAELGVRQSTASFEGRLVTEDGAPLVGAKVYIVGGSTAFHVTESAPDGTVQFGNLPALSLYVFVELDSRKWLFRDIVIPQGERVTRTWTFGSATLRGRVVQGAAKEPVPGARVVASGVGAGIVSATADAQGRFTISRLVSGSYAVGASAESDEALKADASGVAVPADGEITIELTAYGRVRARIVPAERARLRAATIQLRSTDGARSEALQSSDAADVDLVSGWAPPGSYEVVVELEGRTRRFPVEVKGRGITSVDIGPP